MSNQKVYIAGRNVRETLTQEEAVFGIENINLMFVRHKKSFT